MIVDMDTVFWFLSTIGGFIIVAIYLSISFTILRKPNDLEDW